MKRICCIILCALGLVISCGPANQEPGPDKTPLAVSPLSVEFVALGEQKVLSVTSASDWLVRSSQSWVKALTSKGTPANKQITLQADENKEKSPRSAVITISNLDGESVQVAVSQEASSGEEVPRGIFSAEDLVGLSKAVREGGSVARYLVEGVIRLNQDIDASSITEWIPIGDEEHPLTYDFDGNNRSITGVNWTVDAGTYPHAGLVGVGNNITISKLTFGGTGDKVVFRVSGSGNVCAGGIIGRGSGVTLKKVTNNAALSFSGSAAAESELFLGGLAGWADDKSIVGGEEESTQACRSLGNLSSALPAKLGGIVGSNRGTIRLCTFRATVSAPRDGENGPAWLCAWSDPLVKNEVAGNSGYGFVGETPACLRNAMLNAEEAFNPETNTVDWTLDAYYDWTEVETKQLHSGATYHHYSCINVPREVYVVEVDLTNPGIEITAALAGDIAPNPNGNNNSNNGKNLRELLSEICVRKRAEGQKILAGVNASFFDSNDGICRGFHVEERQPVYINNPAAIRELRGHEWGFTVFTDGTAACGKKSFSGKLRHDGEETSYYSVNDTILRHSSADYQANLYTSRYVRQPYPQKPALINDLAQDVLYVICEYTGTPMEVNAGYAQARVVEIVDGRAGPITLPYLTGSARVGIALSGSAASRWKSKVSVGDTVELRCDISVDGVSTNKPILTQVTTMYELMKEGGDNTTSVGSASVLHTSYDPTSFPVVSQDLKKVWIVEVDGRQLWYSMGVKGYEMYRIAKKLGGWWMTRFDGGGSAAMWLWDQSRGSGGLVSRPSDSKGERSCMNYLLIREK